MARSWERAADLAEKPGERSTPTLLARHLSTGPSRSPRMGAGDPPRPGRHGRRIAVLFGQLCRLGLKPMQARFAPHDQPHVGGNGNGLA
jgi:hypothetical protein